ncbi:hypothetical protein JCM5296_000624 [Sporobolomyces johnsonii]
MPPLAPSRTTPSDKKKEQPAVQTHGTSEDDPSDAVAASKVLLLALLSVGIVYGDIGTSPLYALSGLFPSRGPIPTKEDVIGGVSAILWAITLVPFIKYAAIALAFGSTHSDTAGEGGPYALWCSMFPPHQNQEEGVTPGPYTDANSSADVSPSIAKAMKFFRRKTFQAIFYGLVLFGVALTISDGLLTPAVSVVSAVQGIAIASPSVGHSIVPISCAILVVLFCLQPFGTRRVGSLFAPIMCIWFILIFVSGIINVTHYPGIFRAFDPSRAVMLFVRTKNYDLLQGVILALTGVEAMFANLGQFDKRSIRLAFTCFIYPALCLAYLGQGARLIQDPVAVLQNPFFHSIPGGSGSPFWWCTWVVAILAAIIASQALITATFSLVQQLTTLQVLPPIKVVHTDDSQQGRIYIPVVNFLLLVGTIGLTVGFGQSSNLTNAFGFAVSGVFIITTLTISVAIVEIKHLPIILALVFLVLAGFVDCLFFGATIKKVPHGAWFPLGLACLLVIFFIGWSAAKSLERTFDRKNRHRLSDLLHHPNPPSPGEKVEEGGTSEAVGAGEGALPQYGELQGFKGMALARLPVFALFHDQTPSTQGTAPHSFTAFLRSYPSLPQIIVFLTIRTVAVPHVAEEDRYLVSRLRSFDGVYLATLSFGYRDSIDLSNVAQPLRDRIVALETRGSPEGIEQRIAKVDCAIKGSVTHILPHLHIMADPEAPVPKVVRYVRTFLLEEVYRRVKVNFPDFALYRFQDAEDVLRMGVCARL